MSQAALSIAQLPSAAPPRAVSHIVAGPLTRAEAIDLRMHPVGGKSAPIQKLRQHHHRLALLLAQGYDPITVSAMTGYSPERISALRSRDPSFMNLIAHYVKVGQLAAVNMAEVASDTGVAMLDELRTRMEIAPESFSNGDLIRGAQALMDRTGHGPSRTLNVNDYAGVIREIVDGRRIARVVEPLTIEGSVSEAGGDGGASPSGNAPDPSITPPEYLE